MEATNDILQSALTRIFKQIETRISDPEIRTHYWENMLRTIESMEEKAESNTTVLLFEMTHYYISEYIDMVDHIPDAGDIICELFPEHCDTTPREICSNIFQPVCGIKRNCTATQCYEELTNYQNRCHAENDHAELIKPGRCDGQAADFVMERIDYADSHERAGP